jgi:hypothetical protein
MPLLCASFWPSFCLSWIPAAGVPPLQSLPSPVWENEAEELPPVRGVPHAIEVHLLDSWNFGEYSIRTAFDPSKFASIATALQTRFLARFHRASLGVDG